MPEMSLNNQRKSSRVCSTGDTTIQLRVGAGLEECLNLLLDLLWSVV